MPVLTLWAQFLFCAFFILVSGQKLSFYADVIAERFNLSKGWIGLLILAPVTSLPEFFNGISAVLWLNAPNIAVGDILGSCVCNLSFLAILDLISGRVSLSQRLKGSHFLSANFGIIMICLIGFGILIGKHFYFAWFSLISLGLFFLYFIALGLVFREEVKIIASELVHPEVALDQAIKKFLLNAAIIILAATWLPRVGKELALVTGLGQTFIGSSLIAFSTSLPEFVVTLSAFRLGSADMAVANILGSNIVNLFLISIYDFLYLSGPLLTFVDQQQFVNIFSAVLMTTTFILDIYLKPAKRAIFSFLSVFLISIYCFNSFVLYLLR